METLKFHGCQSGDRVGSDRYQNTEITETPKFRGSKSRDRIGRYRYQNTEILWF